MTEISESPCAEFAGSPAVGSFAPYDRWYARRAGIGLYGWGGPRFRTNVVELDDAFEIVAELPGLPRQGLQVRLQGSELTLRAETPAPATGGTGDGSPSEGPQVVYDRTFELPEAVAASAIRAKYENGVLIVRIPKPTPAPEEMIPVA